MSEETTGFKAYTSTCIMEQVGDGSSYFANADNHTLNFFLI
jgi:hypothetical protein